MHHIDHLNDGTHTYCYGVRVSGSRVINFDVTLHESSASAADKALDAILKAQGIPFACAFLRSSTDIDAAESSRATNKH